MPNNLINETSPYLLQHVNNPVNWYPWNKKALQKAKIENKPIFLSIGYSACHWCHVMERESFENETIAALMNKYFINIKVDREERPDLDAIYMEAVVAMTGQGGWPMSVWLTPDGVPFYGGTYFPPTSRMGMPGFAQVLESLAQFYKQQPEKINAQSQQLLNRMGLSLSLNLDEEQTVLDPAVPELATQAIARITDYTHGGTQGAPKFPQPMIYNFLLQAQHRNKRESLLEIVDLTLQKMAYGGIYDHLGGGFHRYSTDEQWLVPHFEKMLYDNALLARLYLHAYQVTHKPLYKQIVEETLTYVMREMTDSSGGFYSSQDADSEGEEGKFFVWTVAEIKAILGKKAGTQFCMVYDVTERGNWDGQSILHLKKPLAEIAQDLKVNVETLQFELTESKKRLFEYRENRIKPNRDEKILTAWNGLMLAAFAEAGRVLNHPNYLATAQKNADFLLTNLTNNSNRLLRTWKAGKAKLMAYLEDYAFLANGLLALYQSTFNEKYFVKAKLLMDSVLTHFKDTKNGGFFDTADDHEQLVVRPKNLQDNAIPSGNAMAIKNLLHLAAYTGDDQYYQLAHQTLKAMQSILSQHPTAFAHWLTAFEFDIAPAKEIAIIGKLQNPTTQDFLTIIQKPYRPNQVIALNPEETTSSAIPLLNHRLAQLEKPTVYICQNFTCQLPITNPKKLKKYVDK